MAEYPRLRVILVLIVLVLIIIGLFELFTPKSRSVSLPPVPGSEIVNQNVSSVEHSTNLGTQDRVQEAKNLKHQALENKAKSGSDVFLSGLFNSASNQQEKPSVSNNTNQASSEVPAKSPEQILGVSGQRGAGVMSPSQLEQALNNRNTQNSDRNNNANLEYGQNQMNLANQLKASIDNYSSQWNLPTQSYVVGESSSTSTTAGGLPALPPQVLITAGTILFAVLENALNSDQSGTPVLAQIIAGKYRGAELMGTFSTSNDDKLVIQFNRMILPGATHALSINAYAIDPKTAENALASGVDHHYLERYGSLFVASMMQGFGNAYSNYQNPCYGTNNCFIDGNVQRTDVTTKTAMYQGLGQIGTNAASQVQNNFNRPDTVYVRQGIGMGILFMQNVNDQASMPAGANALEGVKSSVIGVSKSNLNQVNSLQGSGT